MRILGTSNDVTSCDCCGREGLKKTIAIDMQDASGVVFYGSGCAMKVVNWSQSAIETRAARRIREPGNAARIGAVIASRGL